MRTQITFIAGLTLASASAMASTSLSFGDGDFAANLVDRATPAGLPLIIFDLFDDGSDEPVVMLATASAPYGVLSNTLPAPAAPTGAINNLVSRTKGGPSGGESKEAPPVALVPLPAPAGLALAGVLLIAGVRRR